MNWWSMAFTIAPVSLLPVVLGLASIPTLPPDRAFIFFLFFSPSWYEFPVKEGESCSCSFPYKLSFCSTRKTGGVEWGWHKRVWLWFLTLPGVPFSQLTGLRSILKSPLHLSFEHRWGSRRKRCSPLELHTLTLAYILAETSYKVIWHLMVDAPGKQIPFLL